MKESLIGLPKTEPTYQVNLEVVKIIADCTNTNRLMTYAEAKKFLALQGLKSKADYDREFKRWDWHEFLPENPEEYYSKHE